MKKKMILLCAMIMLLGGCTKYIADDNKKRVVYEVTGQSLPSNILCKPSDDDLASIYEKDKFHILTKEEYIDIVCDQLRLLNQGIVIMRITGDPTLDELIAPDWLIKKFVVLNDIDKEMVKRNIYQGDLL